MIAPMTKRRRSLRLPPSPLSMVNRMARPLRKMSLRLMTVPTMKKKKNPKRLLNPPLKRMSPHLMTALTTKKRLPKRPLPMASLQLSRKRNLLMTLLIPMMKKRRNPRRSRLPKRRPAKSLQIQAIQRTMKMTKKQRPNLPPLQKRRMNHLQMKIPMMRARMKNQPRKNPKRKKNPQTTMKMRMTNP